jgi:ribosome-binding factor A
LRHVLTRILRRDECRDPALRDANIAVTEVRFSSDLRNATVFVMPLGGANATQIIAGLKRSAGFLRRLVARDITLRYTPNLAFELDVSFDQAQRVAALLSQPEIRRDLRPGAAPTGNRDDDS